MTAIAQKSDGLTQMRALATSKGGSGMGALMAMDGGEAGEGTMIMHAIPGSQHGNPIGIVHGGMLSALYTLPVMIGLSGSASRNSTIISWPRRGI
jgi:hypothetical protein